MVNGELQCTLPQTIVMKVPNGKLVTKSTLIDVSKDMGRKWFFIDCLGRNIKTPTILSVPKGPSICRVHEVALRINT